MIFIVACHFLQYYGNELAWWFNVGVEMFLCISGFLYGSKRLGDPLSFVLKNFKKILVPYYVLMLILLPVYMFFSKTPVTPTMLISVVFCVQAFPGLNHLWFISYILFCYIITPFLEYVRSRLDGKSLLALILALIAIFFAGQLINLFYLPAFSFYRISAYILGYFLAVAFKRYGRDFQKKLWLIFLISAIILNAFRVYGQYINDMRGSKIFLLYASYAHVVLGVAIFLTGYVWCRGVKKNLLFSLSDKYSFHIYLVHQFFILSEFNLLRITNYAAINILICLAAILVSGALLKHISDLAFILIDKIKALFPQKAAE
jgi:peptidoglycan/LPS O-acetylase OafA/YrhL